MENKIYLKKYLIKTLMIVSLFLTLFTINNYLEYTTCKKNFNYKINGIIKVISEEYKDVDEKEIIKLLNAKSKKSTFIEKYGINLEENIIIENDKVNSIFSLSNTLLIILFSLSLIYTFLAYNKKKDKEINKITKCIEEINKKNYKLDINGVSEDELSILKNEIYKTTIMLKEDAENSKKDKINLKTSLEDISHQLKTPLTSILITLDTLIEDDNMDEEVRLTFLRNIKKEITNINFLVSSLLKLSKFDANSINFIKSVTTTKELVMKSIENLETLIDLKNIKININEISNKEIICDEKWQVEALTNIIKNCLEHSKDSGVLEITLTSTSLYKEIRIKDYGTGIKNKDLPHIFKRFYNGENSSIDSIGIGLALAKTIIEKENGDVEVKSKEDEYTEFIIKYFD